MESRPLNTPAIEWIIAMLNNPDSWIHDRGFDQMKATLIRHVQSHYGPGNFKHDRQQQC